MYSEYLAFIKNVTDTFMYMNREQVEIDGEMTNRFIVNVSDDGEITYKKSEMIERDGMGDWFENHYRKHNSAVAKKYLEDNVISYETYINIYGKK